MDSYVVSSPKTFVASNAIKFEDIGLLSHSNVLRDYRHNSAMSSYQMSQQ